MFSTRRLLFNALTFVPGAMLLPMVRSRLDKRAPETGGTNQGRYCYSVWLRHLVHAHENGLNVDPKIVAELGPGDSVGIGLAALLTGAEQYYAFDVVKYANTGRNLTVFEELVRLFQERADIPGPQEFPRVGPPLANYAFPRELLHSERLAQALQPERVARIRACLSGELSEQSMIQYRAPWNARDTVVPETVDMVFSQAVLEHVDDLPDVYRTLHSWIRPGGYMSHQIDFKCHGSAREWNGHWTYSDLMWKLARGKQVWLINRAPHSVHVRLMREAGFRIVEDAPVKAHSKIERRQLAPQFRDVTDDDLTTCDAFIQAIKI